MYLPIFPCTYVLIASLYWLPYSYHTIPVLYVPACFPPIFENNSNFFQFYFHSQKSIILLLSCLALLSTCFFTTFSLVWFGLICSGLATSTSKSYALVTWYHLRSHNQNRQQGQSTATISHQQKQDLALTFSSALLNLFNKARQLSHHHCKPPSIYSTTRLIRLIIPWPIVVVQVCAKDTTSLQQVMLLWGKICFQFPSTTIISHWHHHSQAMSSSNSRVFRSSNL